MADNYKMQFPSFFRKIGAQSPVFTRFFWVWLLPLLAWSIPASATMVVQLKLDQIVDRAGQAFVGRCVNVSEAWDESGYPAVTIDFAVEHPIKGVTTDIVTVKQFGILSVDTSQELLPVLRPGEDAIVTVKGGSAPIQYRADEEVILFVYPNSPLGFTSPVGMGQGLFRVSEVGDGRRIVNNDFNARFLQSVSTRHAASGTSHMQSATLSSKAAVSSPVDLEDFLRQVRGMVAR